MIRRLEFAQLNGQRYLRYGDDHHTALVLFHETAVDELRGFDAWIADQRAPAADWVTIYRSGNTTTKRLHVPGGWLVRHTCEEGATMAYVPDPKTQWKIKPIE